MARCTFTYSAVSLENYTHPNLCSSLTSPTPLLLRPPTRRSRAYPLGLSVDNLPREEHEGLPRNSTPRRRSAKVSLSGGRALASRRCSQKLRSEVGDRRSGGMQGGGWGGIGGIRVRSEAVEGTSERLGDGTAAPVASGGRARRVRPGGRPAGRGWRSSPLPGLAAPPRHRQRRRHPDIGGGPPCDVSS